MVCRFLSRRPMAAPGGWSGSGWRRMFADRGVAVGVQGGRFWVRGGRGRRSGGEAVTSAHSAAVCRPLWCARLRASRQAQEVGRACNRRRDPRPAATRLLALPGNSKRLIENHGWWGLARLMGLTWVFSGLSPRLRHQHLCVVFYFYPETCGPKGHGSSSAAAEAAAALLFACILILPQTGIAGHSRAPLAPAFA